MAEDKSCNSPHLTSISKIAAAASAPCTETTPSKLSVNMRYDSFWSIQIDKKKYKFLSNFLIFVIFQKGMNGHTVKSPIYRFGVYEFWLSLVFCS